jgi:hypothetical protein
MVKEGGSRWRKVRNRVRNLWSRCTYAFSVFTAMALFASLKACAVAADISSPRAFELSSPESYRSASSLLALSAGLLDLTMMVGCNN